MYLTQPSRRDTAHIHHTMKYFGIFLCSSLLMTSCATVFCGSKAKVTFDSDIAEKATLTIDGPQIHQCHFPLHDQNQTRFRRNGRQSRIACLYNGNGYHQQKFQRRIGHQSAEHTRMGNRRCDRSHDQTGIQILSD